MYARYVENAKKFIVLSRSVVHELCNDYKIFNSELQYKLNKANMSKLYPF